jgi:hypothetical protein
VNCGETLPCMQACFREGLRIYLPGPIAVPMSTPRGAMIDIGGIRFLVGSAI